MQENKERQVLAWRGRAGPECARWRKGGKEGKKESKKKEI
jgi:hypothetical protein